MPSPISSSSPPSAAEAIDARNTAQTGPARLTDPVTFETAVRPHYTPLVRRLVLVLGNRHDAEDIAQDAYLRAFRSWDRFDGADVRAWLHTIALRLAFNQLRRRRRWGAPKLEGDWNQEFIAYDATAGRIVAYHSTRGWWLLDPRTGVWSEGKTSAPPAPAGWMGTPAYGIAYDEATKQMVVFSGGTVIAYDAAMDHWETLREAAAGDEYGPANRLGHSMVYDPMNERLVVYGGEVSTSTVDGGWVGTDDVLAFDPATRTWTELLAPSTPYAQGTN